MNEPTIDEMLEWLTHFKDDRQGYFNDRMASGIRAILEQHRDGHLTEKELDAALKDYGADPDATATRANAVVRKVQLQAIRAFVERVDAQYMIARTNDLADVGYYRTCVIGELAAMEKADE